MSADLYSPWREPQGVQQRHVGRKRELDAIANNARAFFKGGAPLPMYVFGPRGVGKSHLLMMVRPRVFAENKDARVVWVPEDIPELRSAEQLIARMEQGARPRRWRQWKGERTRGESADATSGRRMVLLEGLDRQLHALGASGRHELRRLLDDRDDLWLVGTGVSLSAAFTGHDEAFYGAFDLRPLEPLNDEEATTLLDTIALGPKHDQGGPPHGETAARVGESDRWSRRRVWGGRWPMRRRTLVALAGGNARALVALGLACKRDPHGWASQQLHEVLRDFTAHYQMRFRDLSPQHQQMVALLAEAPRELTPSDFARELGSSTSQMSVQAVRLVDDGVFRQRTAVRHGGGRGGRDKRQTWYELAEPLFRFWLEYRNTDWNETRAGWLGRLLEALMTPHELAAAWWAHPDEGIRRAAGRVLNDSQTSAAWVKLYEQATAHTGETALEVLVERAAALQPSPVVPAFIMRVVELAEGSLLEGDFAKMLADDSPKYDAELALIRLDGEFRKKGATPRDAFMAFVDDLSMVTFGANDALRLHALLAGCIAVLSRHRRGGPWKLRAEERELVSTIPVLRAYLSEHGRLATHGPMLSPKDILAALKRGGDQAEPALDAGALILTGVVRGDATLIERAAQAFDARSAWAFAPCPLPAVTQPAQAADAVVDAAKRTGGSGRVLMTWAASFVELSDERFASILKDLPNEVSGFSEQTEIAFAALAMRRRDRFDALAAALSNAWTETCDHAALLAAQLREAELGHLHPELETLRRAFKEAAA